MLRRYKIKVFNRNAKNIIAKVTVIGTYLQHEIVYTFRRFSHDRFRSKKSKQHKSLLVGLSIVSHKI